mgnify:FL=1
MKINEWPRHGIQALWAALTNSHISGFITGKIYTGKLKNVCVPGLNCYSCPGARGACPIGSLQAVIGSWNFKMAYYVAGFLIFVGALLGRLVCGFLCPFGLIQDLLNKIPFPKKIRTFRGDKLLRKLKYVIFLVFVIILPMFVVDIMGQGAPYFCKLICPAGTLEGGIPLVLLNKSMRSAVGWLYMWKNTILVITIILSIMIYRPFCKYICPLGAASNIFKFTLLFVIAALGGWALGALGVANAWVWTIGGACLAAYIVEIAKMRSCTFPLMYIKRDLNTCNNCGLCEKKCPYQLPIHDYVKVKHVDCTLCGNCIGACAKDALQVNGRRSLRWVPGLLAVVLFFLAIWLGSTMELPTIDEKWGDYEKVENLQTFEMEGLQTIKCFGSSKAFSAKMQAVQGVYGVKTFVRRHGVEVLYDPAATDTLKIQAAIFAPTLRKYAMPGEQVPMLDVVKLGVEGLHDRMDMIYFGMVLQKIEGVYGFTSEFACPVDVTVYVDPAAGITEKMFGEAIDAKELVIPTKESEKVIPMHTVLKSYAVAGQVSREEFAQIMFRDVEKLAGRFVANQEKWGDDEQFPKAVYEMVFPGIEKMPIRNAFPYFKSFLSCTDGIVSVDFVLRDMKPVMRIRYVKSMWDDAKLWKEVFQAEKWTLRMADGTFKEADPRLKFTNPGKTVGE